MWVTFLFPWFKGDVTFSVQSPSVAIAEDVLLSRTLHTTCLGLGKQNPAQDHLQWSLADPADICALVRETRVPWWTSIRQITTLHLYVLQWVVRPILPNNPLGYNIRRFCLLFESVMGSPPTHAVPWYGNTGLIKRLLSLFFFFLLRPLSLVKQEELVTWETAEVSAEWS